MLRQSKKVLLGVVAAFLMVVATASARTPTKKPAPNVGPPKCSCACKSGTTCKSGGSEVSCDSYKATFCTGAKQPR